MDRTFTIIDGSAFVHRAYHAVRGLATAKGLPTNAVFAYTRMMLALLRQKAPEFAAVVWDAKGPTFRHEIYPAYKANRPPMEEELSVQIPYVRRITEALRVPAVEVPGFEADDLAGALGRQAREQGFSVIYVTGDKDFLQLVEPGVSIFDPMKESLRDYEAVKADLGIEPALFRDVLALWGDSSDNVPGVPGIGEKTALALVKEFGSIEGIYENIEKITKKKQRENLESGRAALRLGRRLVTIDTQAPVSFSPEAFRVKPPDYERLAPIFSELEFTKLAQEFAVAAPSGPAADMVPADYRPVTDDVALMELAALLSASPEFSLDTETTSVSPMSARLVGLSFSAAEGRAFYVPVGHTMLAAPRQPGIERVREILGPVLANPGIAKVGQNIKYDLIVLFRHGFEVGNVAFDTMIASYLLNPSLRAHSLDKIALDHLGHRMIAYEEVAGKGKAAVTFDHVPVAEATAYSGEDADLTLRAKTRLSELLSEKGLSDLFRDVEMPLVSVLTRMEMRGIRVDREHLAALSREFTAEMLDVERKIYELAGGPFNIASPRQLGHVLFEKLSLPTGKKTKKKTGYSTDVTVLEELAPAHELPAQILRYRTLAKLKSTYADALVSLIHPETGRVHTSFNQNVAATGRLSSSDPNLQNIPIRSPEGKRIRAAFVPEPGWVLFSADYSQIELRILAHCAKDPVLTDSFRKNEDVHTRTASEIFDLDPAFITEEMRRQAKSINFGLIYGMGPFKLSNELGISQSLARRYMDRYFSTYTGVKGFVEEAISSARATGRTTTLAGRIRLIPEITGKDRVLREAAERIAINTPIQGTAADFIKIAMIRVEKALSDRKMRTAMLLTVHDELVFEGPPDELASAKDLVRHIMENVWELSVPLTVNMAEGKNWAEAH